MPKQLITDEAEALRQAFAESVAKGKVFNVISWKKKRENQRILESKLNKIAGF